jgi:hypothetical protein
MSGGRRCQHTMSEPIPWNVHRVEFDRGNAIVSWLLHSFERLDITPPSWDVRRIA